MHRETMPFLRGFSNLRKMLVFMPLGHYMPVLIPGMRRLTKTLLAVVCASAARGQVCTGDILVQTAAVSPAQT